MTAATGAWASIVASGDCGTGVTYTLTDDGVLTISKTGSGTGAMADFTDSWGSNPNPWEANKAAITSVVIESGVTSICNYAFRECTKLTSVTIPASVTSIGVSAFELCGIDATAMTVTFAEESALTSISLSAFCGCSNLTSVTIPNGVTTIDKNAFQGCTNLSSVTIPNGVTSIGEIAFQGCTNLTSIIIPQSVTYIGISAFYGCSSLTSVTITNGVMTIDDSAFANSGLTSVDIPASVTRIGWDAFAGCSNLTSITLNSNPRIGDDAFPDGAAVTMNVPANLADGAYWTTFYNSNYSFLADANTQVFKVERNGTELTMHEVEDKIVNNNLSVVLKTTGGNPVMMVTKSTSSNTDGTLLSGVYGPEGETSDGKMFVLHDGSQGVGFYRLKSGKTLGIGKAYLYYDGALARDFFGFGAIAGINEVIEQDEEVRGEYYDLQGRRVAQPTKGLYIVKGKKVIIK